MEKSLLPPTQPKSLGFGQGLGFGPEELNEFEDRRRQR